MTTPPDIEELVKRARLKAELFTRFEQPSHADAFSDLASALEAQAARVKELERDQFQDRVQPWMMACFGPEISADKSERNHRFLEEALELVQSCGCSRSEAHQLVDYVYDRPVGEPHQEVGGVQVTLAALCLAQSLDMHKAGEDELSRIWTKVDKIRAKQAAKPRHSPLPAASRTSELEARITALEAQLAEFREASERVRHKKRGSTYRVIGRGELQSASPIAEGTTLVAYRCEIDGRLWFRPATEFDDGRFEALTATPKKTEALPVEPEAERSGRA